MKYYEITENELEQIRAKMPKNIAFGFESYGKFYFSSQTVEAIDLEHGELLSLIFMGLFGKEKDEFLNEKESGSFEKYILQKQKNLDGLDAYEKMIGFVHDRGGLGVQPTSLDNVEIPGYLLMTNIRMMLKDGMFETALRYWFTVLKPVANFAPEIEEFVVPIMEQLVAKYMTLPDGSPATEQEKMQMISALKVVGKGFL